MQKNSSFTLIEVAFSLFILITSVYLLSNLQFRALDKARATKDEIIRVFFIKKYLYKLYISLPKKDKPLKVVMENPNVVITSHKQEINKKSSLKQFAKDIDIIWTSGNWKQAGIFDKELKMISFVHKQNKKEITRSP